MIVQKLLTNKIINLFVKIRLQSYNNHNEHKLKRKI
jgi:hypothetical protein